VGELNCSCGATCSEVEALQAEVEKWKREAGNYKGSFEVMCEACGRKDSEYARLSRHLNQAISYLDVYVKARLLARWALETVV
jgi:hypothetical protein